MNAQHPDYTVAPIAPGQVDQAYVLIRLADPAMTLEEWRETCGAGGHSFSDGAGSWPVSQVLVAVGPRGYLHGLSLIGRMRYADGARTIEVEALLAPSALDAQGVCGALLHALAVLCREHGCERLTVGMPPSDVCAYAALCRAAEAQKVDFDRLAIQLRPPVTRPTE